MTNSSETPIHRADLAGALAARTTAGRYIEIISGLLLGCLMWILDAAMHTRLNAMPSLRLFLDESVSPGITPIVFRTAFVAIAIGVGWLLWRKNLRREATERQEHEQALASERLRTMLAVVNTVRFEVNKPLALIVDNAQRLANQSRSTDDHEKLDEIFQLAARITRFTKQLAESAPLYLVDTNGRERVVLHEQLEEP